MAENGLQRAYKTVNMRNGIFSRVTKLKTPTQNNMLITNYTKPKVYIIISVVILVFGLLIWQNFHGGVPSHHVLQNKDLPEISNWWGALLIPILTWIVINRIEKRLRKKALSQKETKNQTLKIFELFVLGLTFGLVIALSFTNDFKLLLDNIPYVFLIMSLFVPIFYAEFILGFVFGMTYAFGALLPTVFILIIAGLGFVIYRFIRPLILRVIKISANN